MMKSWQSGETGSGPRETHRSPTSYIGSKSDEDMTAVDKYWTSREARGWLSPREGGWKCFRYSGATTAINPTENPIGEANSNNSKMERMFAALLPFRQRNEYPAYRIIDIDVHK